MSKRDFELLAAILKSQKDDASSLAGDQREHEMCRVRLVAESMSHVFTANFPRFNPQMFLTACGY